MGELAFAVLLLLAGLAVGVALMDRLIRAVAKADGRACKIRKGRGD